MSEFGGRSELGRSAESDRRRVTPQEGKGYDWSIELGKSRDEVEKLRTAAEARGETGVRPKRRNPDVLGECKGESDSVIASPTESAAAPKVAAPLAPARISAGGDWSKRLKMPSGTATRGGST